MKQKNKMEQGTKIFEEIKLQCASKEVVSLCNKLIKRCSFRSMQDAQNLCRLTYKLYLLDCRDLAMLCIALTKTVDFNFDFGVWDPILCMWGLEVRMLREDGKNSETQAVADKMVDCYLASKDSDDTREIMLAKMKKWIDRHTLSFLDNADKIEESLKDGDIKDANSLRLTALFSLIAKLESGLFPNLNENRDEVEAKIEEYIGELRK